MNVIIFSMNRPMQLDLLLRSFTYHFKEWEQAKKHVIFLATSDKFKKGYEILKNTFTEFNFIEQGYFKSDILNVLDLKQQFTMFLVDDIVFKSNFSVSDSVFNILVNNNQMISLSLRLHTGLRYCYATNKSMRLPNFVRKVYGHYNVWKWPGADGDWGYGLSLDGDIFNTSFIAPLLYDYNYQNPNQLEAVLNSPQTIRGIWPIYKCCYDGPSKLINNPANRVQHEFKNRFENIHDVDKLIDLFLEGKRISINGISNINNGSVHFPMEYDII